LSFGLGFAVQILLHELGHYIDIKRRDLPADMPVFLPGVGAYVRWQALGVPLKTRSRGESGRSAGGLHCGYGLFAGLVSVWRRRVGCPGAHGAWINLLNLIPVWGLDGGHAFLALTRRHRILVLTVTLAALIFTGESIFVLILIGAGWRCSRKIYRKIPAQLQRCISSECCPPWLPFCGYFPETALRLNNSSDSPF